MAFILSLGLAWMIYPYFIAALKQKSVTQHVSEYAIESYKQKERTPIFGGVVFLLVATGVTLFVGGSNLDFKLLSVLIHTLLFASIGLVDDIKIVKEGKNDGLSGKTRLVLQTLFAFSFVWLTLDVTPIPFFSFSLSLPLWFTIPVRVFMIVGSINAFNITDGMDGLSAGLAMFVLGGLAVLSLNQTSYALTFIFALLGSLLAFLIFNFSPAKIFMGDVGSYGLGGALIMIGMILNQEIIFILLYAVYLVEVICVIIQQVAVRVFKRRVFSYTPIHYAFVLKGMKDVNVVLMFYVYGAVSLGIGLLTYFIGGF